MRKKKKTTPGAGENSSDDSLKLTEAEIKNLITAAKKYHRTAAKPYERNPALPHDEELARFDDIMFRLDFFQQDRIRRDRGFRGNEIHESHLKALSAGIADRLVSKGKIDKHCLQESGLGRILADPVMKKKLLAASEDVNLYLHVQGILWSFSRPPYAGADGRVPPEIEEKIRRRFKDGRPPEDMKTHEISPDKAEKANGSWAERLRERWRGMRHGH